MEHELSSSCLHQICDRNEVVSMQSNTIIPHHMGACVCISTTVCHQIYHLPCTSLALSILVKRTCNKYATCCQSRLKCKQMVTQRPDQSWLNEQNPCSPKFRSNCLAGRVLGCELRLLLCKGGVFEGGLHCKRYLCCCTNTAAACA